MSMCNRFFDKGGMGVLGSGVICGILNWNLSDKAATLLNPYICVCIC
jgi:hypothetical protein